jgi:hypothetical protein
MQIWAKLLRPASFDDEVAAEFSKLTSAQVQADKVEGVSQLAQLFHSAVVAGIEPKTSHLATFEASATNLDAERQVPPDLEAEPLAVVQLLIPFDQADSILQALNTTRLVLATALQLETEADSDHLYQMLNQQFGEGPAGEPVDEPADELGDAAQPGGDAMREFHAVLFALLGALQEMLLDAIRETLAFSGLPTNP